MRYLLKELKIEGFRGINNATMPLTIAFHPDKVNSVFASNAQGKSSVFQALCYALTGQLHALHGMHRSEDAGEYLTNRFHPTRTAVISLTLTDDSARPRDLVFEITVSPVGRRAISAPPEISHPEVFLKELAGPLTLLDYSTFQRFVADSPLDRGRTFSSLLGLERLSELRQTLEVLSNPTTLPRDLHIAELTSRATAEREVAGRSRDNAMRLLSSISTQSLPPGPSPEAVRALTFEELRRTPEITATLGEDPTAVDFVALRESLRITEQAALTNEASALLNQANRLRQLLPTGSEHDERLRATALVLQLEEAIAMSPGLLIRNALQAALGVLESTAWPDTHTCPVCDDVKDFDLAEHVRVHLRAFEAVDNITRLLTETIRHAQWYRAFNELSTATDIEHSDEERALHTHLNGAIANGTVTRPLLQSAFTLLEAQRDRITARVSDLETRRNAITAALPQSLLQVASRVETAERIYALLEEWQRAAGQESHFSARLRVRDRWSQFVQRATTTCAEAETALSTSRVTALEPEYRDLYQTIVPSGQVVPKLARVQGSEELMLMLENFYGLHNLKAPALLSEAYRNALAISLYLSAALSTPHVAGFIVLDDITSSFDAGLQLLLMDALRLKVRRGQSPTGLQIVLLSHDGILEKQFDKLVQEGDWLNQRLFGRPPVGALEIRERDGKRLRTAADQFLARGEDDQAGPLVRQYLEAKILEVLRQIGIAVPLDFALHDANKMCDAGLRAIDKAVALQAAHGDLVLSAQQVAKLTSSVLPGTIGNTLSHFPTGTGHGLSAVVLEAALRRVDEFVGCFEYQCSCTGTPKMRYYRSLTARDCLCR